MHFALLEDCRYGGGGRRGEEIGRCWLIGERMAKVAATFLTLCWPPSSDWWWGGGKGEGGGISAASIGDGHQHVISYSIFYHLSTLYLFLYFLIFICSVDFYSRLTSHLNEAGEEKMPKEEEDEEDEEEKRLI